MNVTYKDLKEGYILKDRDEIVIHGAKHRAMLSDANNEYYLNYEGVNNDALDYERKQKSYMVGNPYLSCAKKAHLDYIKKKSKK